MSGDVKLTAAQWDDLTSVAFHNGISIYSPTQRSFDRFGPLQDIGFLQIRIVEIDEQESKLRVEPTAAGRAALAERGRT